MFRGSLKENTLYAILEYVEAVVNISNKYTLEEIMSKGFLDYEEITNPNKVHLNSYLLERGILANQEVEEVTGEEA